MRTNPLYCCRYMLTKQSHRGSTTAIYRSRPLAIGEAVKHFYLATWARHCFLARRKAYIRRIYVVAYQLSFSITKPHHCHPLLLYTVIDRTLTLILSFHSLDCITLMYCNTFCSNGGGTEVTQGVQKGTWPHFLEWGNHKIVPIFQNANMCWC